MFENSNDCVGQVIVQGNNQKQCQDTLNSLVGGLVASGADAYLLHVTTTPSVAYVARTDGFD